MVQISSATPRAGGRGVLPRLPWNTWFFGSLAVALAVWSTWKAATQQPYPDPLRPASWGEWFQHPYQRNGFARNPVIRGDLRTVFAVPGTRIVWAGGNTGLLLRSDDGGATWTRVPVAEPAVRSGDLPSAPASDLPDTSATTALRVGRMPFVTSSLLPLGRLFRQATPPPQQQDTPSTAPRRGALQLWQDENGNFYCSGPAANPGGPDTCDSEGPLQAQEGRRLGDPSGSAPIQTTPPQTGAQRSQQAQQPPAQSGAPDSAPAGIARDGLSARRAGDALAVHDTLQDIVSIHFVDAKRGWLMTHLGFVRETRDGGETWERTLQPVSSGFVGSGFYLLPSQVRFTHRDTGWAAGNGMVLRYTRQGGWWPATLPPDAGQPPRVDLQQVEPVDGTTAYAVVVGRDNRPVLWITRDGAASWSVAPSPAPDTSTAWLTSSVHFVDGGQGWLLVAHTQTDSTAIYVTRNGGASWEPVSRVFRPVDIHFADRSRGIMATPGGALSYTEDGGRTWHSAETGPFGLIGDLYLQPDGRGWAVGPDGLVLTTVDGGRRWSARAGGGDQLRAAAFAGAGGWAAGDRGTLLASRDSGRTWRPHRSGTNRGLLAVYVSPDGLRGWAVGNAGTVVQMRDGRTWAPAPFTPGGNATVRPLRAVQFADVDHGWILAAGRVMYATSNGGATWDSLPRPSLMNPEALFFRSSRLGWIAGRGGVHRTEDGGRTWIAADSAPAAALTSLHFVSDSVGWAAGLEGAILATRDGGRTWTQQRSGTRTVLTAIRFADPRTGWAAGWDGTLVGTRDGGATWLPETSGVQADLLALAQTPAGELWAFGKGGVVLHRSDDGRWLLAAPPGRRLPGPWYVLAVIAIVGLSAMAVPARRPPADPDPVDGVLLSDRPLAPGDPDPLDLNRLARGISRFLRNEGTEPPLTIAITGAWGSGKSSLMNLVRSDLAGRAWRPVWFNAWHHQTEEHLLASLLENVRAQAIPSWLSMRGVIFRLRLLGVRIHRNAVGAGVALVVTVLFVGFLSADPSRLDRAWAAITAAPQAENGGVALLERIANVLFPRDLAAAVLVYGGLGALAALVRALRAFGVSPSKLVASASQAVRLRDLEEKPGFRHRFAVNFQEVTRALRPRDLVIFIDDLDRCRPRNVMTILEAVNFLVSSGECVVIMGMDAPRVIHSVAMELKNEAGGEDPHAFAKRYLEKLINIDVHVPTPEEGKLRLLLLPAPLPPEPSGVTRVLREGGRGARALGPVLAKAAVLATVFLLGRWLSPPVPAPAPAAARSAGVRVVAPSAAAFPRDTVSALPISPASVEVPALPTRSGAVFTLPAPADNDWLLGVGLVLALGVILWRMANRPEAIVRDSDAFSHGRTAWMRYVASRQPTPRRTKKFMNRLRFYAMRQSPATAPDTLRERLVAWMLQIPWVGKQMGVQGLARLEPVDAGERVLPEGVLVGLVSIQEFQPELLRDPRFFRQFRERMAMLSGVQENELERMEYPAALSEDDRALFSSLVEGVRIS
jgi:photosystem II stability/assembly factor-like uncharacterized protein